MSGQEISVVLHQFFFLSFLTVGHTPTKIWILWEITTPHCLSLSRSVSLWKDHGSLIAHNLSFYLVVDNDWRTQEVCNWWWFWFRLLILLYFYSKGNLDAVKMSQDGFSVLFLPPFDDVAEIIAHDYVFVKKCICTCWNTEFGFLTFFIH